MTEIEKSYWVDGVDLPNFRSRLIIAVLDLMDKKYQEDNWLDKKLNQNSRCFAEKIFMIGEEFFDDLLCFRLPEQKDDLLKNLSYMLKEGELEPLLEIYYPLEKLFFDYQYDHEFMTCPELPIVRQRSLEAFKVFIENEKENYNFCENLLAGSIKHENRVKEGECQGKGYEFLKNYIKIVEERGFESSIKYDI